MKILIIGEFSAFSKNLSRGFHALGHESFVFSWGDSFKRIKQDSDSYHIDVSNITLCGHSVKGSNRIKRLFTAPKLHRFIARMPKDWDVAFIINLGFLQKGKNIFSDMISINEIQSLLKDPTQIFLSACGGDYIFDRFFPNRNKKSPYYMEKSKKNLANPRVSSSFNNYMHMVKGVIPITIDYYEAYKYFEDEFDYKLYPIIPLPFDVESVEFKNEIKDKIVIMHGVNRYYEKGSDFIIPAMKRIKNDYPEKVELKIVSHLPLKEYMEIMAESNILIDQAYASSAGMNAVEALAMGKVVLGGNEDGNEKSLGVEKYPVIDIIPNEDQIYSVLKDLVIHPEKIKEISHESRKIACELYDCRRVAERYINLFRKEQEN